MDERAIFSIEMFEEAKKYWLNQLSGELNETVLPGDFPDSHQYEPNISTCTLGNSMTEKLMYISKNNHLSLYIILLTTFKILLYKLTGQEDITVSSPVLKDSNQNYNKWIALRDFLSPEMTFKDFLMTVRETVVDGYKKQYYPIKKIIEFLKIEGKLSLSRVILLLEDIHDREFLRDIRQDSKNDIIFAVKRLGKADKKSGMKLAGEIIYNAKLYKKDIIKRLMDNYMCLLGSVLDNTTVKISHIKIISEKEKKHILFAFNNTKVKYPQKKTIHELFEEQVKKRPAKAALIYENNFLTYNGLYQETNQLANQLRNRGIGPGTIVGIMVKPSLEMVTAILAILKAGGIYLPISHDYPPERVKYTLADSKAILLITRGEIKNNLKKISNEVEIIDVLDQGLYEGNGNAMKSGTTGGDIAYVLYTSGSTGRPKAVMVEHKNVVRLVKNSNYIAFTADDKLLLTGAVVFDITTFEIWGPLLNGLSLYLVDNHVILDAEKLGQNLSKNQISILHLIPQLFNQLLEQQPGMFAGLKYLLVGGDLVQPHYINKVRNRYKSLKILHMYGPTENTTFSTFYPVEKEYHTPMPIGKPISNTCVYILDKSGLIQPLGVAGELCVSGEGVARGYMNNPEITAEKFDHDLWDYQDYQDKKQKTRSKDNYRFYRSNRSYIYKTGDLAKWMPDGNIEFLGRMDHQVKIRGSRIELGEIENRLTQYPGIKEAVVLDKTRQNNEKYLCAYIVTKKEEATKNKTIPLDIQGIKNKLSTILPDYMIPSYFVELDKIPLTSNGKIDRKTLPEPKLEAGVDHTPPGNDIERKLVEIWADVLNINKEVVGIHANFFLLGGHSLKATILASRIHKDFDVKISLKEIFKKQTIKELSQYVSTVSRDKYESIVPVEKKAYYPMSSTQKRLYVLQQLDQESTAYNMPQMIHLGAETDFPRIENTIKMLIKRHESFRTSFHMIDSKPLQKIHDQVDFEIGNSPVKTARDKVKVDAVIRNFIRAFDLSQPPLLRAGLIKIGKTQYILIVDMHHVIFDGMSNNVLQEDFARLYNGEKLGPLRIQYKDYSEWLSSRTQQEKIKNQEQYWLKEFSDELPVLTLPLDYPRPVLQAFVGTTVNFSIGRIETGKLNHLAGETGATLYMVLLSIYYILLSKLSGEEDIIIGSPIAARRHYDLEKIIGMFVNTLAIRNFPNGDKTFTGFLNEVRERSLSASENQEYQFEDLVEKLLVNRDTSRNPIFDVMFNLLPLEKIEGEPEEINKNQYKFKNTTSKFDLILTAFDNEKQLLFTLEYSTKLFKHQTIEKLIEYFKQIVTRVTTHPHEKISDIEIIPGKNRSSKLNYFNESLEEKVPLKPIQAKLADAFQKYRQNIAIEYGTTHLTYTELEHRAACISQWAAQDNIKKGSFIGIYIEDKIDIISAIIGILNQGSVFVPLDTTLPGTQIESRIRHANLRVILTDPGHETILSGMKEKNHPDPRIVVVNNSFYQTHEPGKNNTPAVPCDPEDKTYVYYTSGTTGEPNVIVGKNKSLLQFIEWEIETFSIDETYRFSQFAAVGFDAFLRNIFTPLCAGGTLCIPRNRTLVMDSRELVNWINSRHITLVYCVPSVFHVINSEELHGKSFPRLKYIVLSAEPLKPNELKKWYDIFAERVQLVNYYGTTETTMAKTFHFIRSSDLENPIIPVGRPMKGARIIILDKYMKICDRGIRGEIYIRTAYSTGGYLDNPELTAQRFIKNPYSQNKGDIIYKTGDLGRELENGEIEFLGRIDRQVKIRGIRIELGNIENCLLKHDKIKKAIVTNRKDGDGENCLCAYIVYKKPVSPGSAGPGGRYGERLEPGSGIPTQSELREHLTKELPGYMVPHYFIQIEEVPLTANGKIDWKALPDPGIKIDEKRVAPGNFIEEKLLELWEEVLNIEKGIISINSNFFELGGHSLKVTTLISRIYKELEVRIPLGEMFKAPTIKGLSRYILSTAPGKFVFVPSVEKREYYALSSAQRRLYILHQLEAMSTAYNMPNFLILEENINKEKIKETFIKLISRHESLRTSFEIIDGKPVQRIHDEVEFEIEYHDLQVKAPPQADHHSVENRIIHRFMRPFDLTAAPLLRVGLIKQEEAQYILMLDLHHIITDGISQVILVRDFSSLYNGHDRGPLRIMYKEYSQWLQNPEVQNKIMKQEEYWLKEFQEQGPVLSMPIDYPRPPLQNFQGDIISFEIEDEQIRGLTGIAHVEETTLFMVILAIYNIFLAKLSNLEDIVVGTPIAGRRHTDIEKIVGMFINMLPLRSFPTGDKTFKIFLHQVKEKTIKAFDNQEYQFEDLVEKIVLKRDMSRNPLFEVVLMYQNFMDTVEPAEVTHREAGNLQIKPYPSEHQSAKFDLSLIIIEENEKFHYLFEYCSKIFKQETILKFIQYFKNITAAVIKNPGTRISGIEIMPNEEKINILYRFNDTRTSYSQHKTMHQLYEEQVEQAPDRLALTGESTEAGPIGTGRCALTYGELNKRTNQLARELRKRGVKPNHFVGIVINRSVEMIIAVMAILKAGGAYVPIEPHLPDTRIRTCLAIVNARHLFTNSRQFSSLAPICKTLSALENIFVIDIHDINEIKNIETPDLQQLKKEKTLIFNNQIGKNPTGNPDPAAAAGDIAYVIYTSGTTGTPKGVVEQHRPVVNLIQWVNRTYQVAERDKILFVASLSFDLSVYDIFGVLGAGGSVRVVSRGDLKYPERLLEMIFEEGITFWDSAPAALQQIVPYIQELKEPGHSPRKSKFRLVFLSGDWIPVTLPDILKAAFENIEVIGLGGGTEATIWSNFYPIKKVEPHWNSIPYGKPLQNAKYYILNQYMTPCPINVAGNLYIGGQCLSSGYINDIELTAAKFVPNPFVPAERIYRTGDLARWFPDGNMEFLGRQDNQVKIRGYRVELGDIESQLLKHDNIKEVLVIAREGKTKAKSDKYLCAYYVSPREFTPAQLANYLSASLPEYMIPPYFVRLEKMPVTPNGKVDRKNLPEPASALEAQEYIAPRSQVETRVIDIWSQLLGIEKGKIGINANFFEMGGHSLNATILVSRLHKELNVKIPLVEIFTNPTVKALSQYIDDAVKEVFTAIEPVEKKERYPLTSAQKRVYILQQLELESTGYNLPNTVLFSEGIEIEKLEQAFKKIIQRHESFRTFFEMVNEVPVQGILKEVEFSMNYCDITGEVGQHSEKTHQAPAQENPVKQIIENFRQPFDLSCAPLLRGTLIKIENKKYILLFDIHHIITDGTSEGILINEFMSLYAGQGLPPLRLQYKDYAEWQQSAEQQEIIKKQEEYWLQLYSDDLTVLNFPTDYPRPGIQSFQGDRILFMIEEKDTRAIKDHAAELGVTLFMYILSAFNIMLAKLSGDVDIIVGTPIAARRHADLQRIIGMFVNTLAIRNYPYPGKTFEKFLSEVKEQTLRAYENQEYPFEVLVDKISVARDTSRNPVFDMMFNLLNQGEYTALHDTNQQTTDDYLGYTAKFDINLAAIDLGQKISCNIEYCTQLFKASTIEKIIAYFKKILSHLPANPGQRISDIDIITAEEKALILDMSNGVKETLAGDKTIHQLYEEKAKANPGKIAVVFEEKHITYKNLNERANQMARFLQEKGIAPDTVVGVMVNRSIEMIIAILAVMKAGGAYLPIDPQYPAERITYMLKDSGVSILLTDENAIGNMPGGFLKSLNTWKALPVITSTRGRIYDLNSIPIPDRSLVDYKKYHKFISSAMVKHSVSVQSSRGCPFKCIYCNKICTGKFVQRSVENIFTEIRQCYEAGIRRFTFIDDVFNLDEKNASQVLEKLIKNKMEVQLFFANGLRGDILSKEFIDLMVAAGTTTICLALETGSPRLQKLMKKRLNLEKFKNNLHYLTRKYPHIILELELMHGFPTETEAEAMETLDFLMEIKWVHFPDLHILKIYPQTDMYRLAVESGITQEQIARSLHLAYHEIPETLPFSKDFTRGYQAKFLNDYFFLKERLLQVLPYQVKVLTEDELVQKYDSYLPYDIKSFHDILECLDISREELGKVELMQNDDKSVPDFSAKMSKYFIKKGKAPDALRLLLLDLSLSFTADKNNRLYDVVEAPLGLMYLATYLNKKMGNQVEVKVFKSRIDFDSYEELKEIIFDIKPEMIGIRTLSVYKEFFHHTVSLIRDWGVDVPIISGGPYASTEYNVILQDNHVDIAVLGEGELTITQLIKEMLKNDKKLPGEEVLNNIPGIAFIKSQDKAKAREKNCQTLFMEKLTGELASYSGEDIEHINKPGDLAYVIYTSGSTGIPKGVMLEHRNLTNLIEYDFKYTNIDCSSILQFHTISFDASFHEIFCALLFAGKSVLIGNETRLNISQLLELVEKNKIKTLFLPMSFLRVIFGDEDYIKQIPGCVDHIQTAGEQVIINNALRTYLRDNHAYLHNHYGPSETHVVTALSLGPQDEIPELPPIGKPILNTSIYIKDKQGHLAPPGVPGELFAGGVQVGRGYLGKPNLTREKFIPSPYKEGERLYKTGDLAKWLPDGNIEFLGRIDDQVKIRGFRVEPGEIESRLASHEEVKEVFVHTNENEKREKYLCAYIVPHSPKGIEEIPQVTSRLKSYLSQTLPDYMIPSYFVLLDKIPVTQNGKVNRKALPHPEIGTGAGYIAPGNEIEIEMAAIWAEVLGIDKTHIGIESNFFDIGGHSLKATIMAAKIHKKLNVKLPLVEIFKAPTIKGLSRYLTGAVKNKFTPLEPVEKKEYYPVSSAQKRLFLIQQRDPGSTAYNMIETYISEKEPGKEKFEKIFMKLIRRHESLRTSLGIVRGEPVQYVGSGGEFEIRYYETGKDGKMFPVNNQDHGPGSDISNRFSTVEDTIKNFIKPFDLTRAPLMRVGLIRYAPPQGSSGDNYILMVDMHHIITDAISHEILVEDFLALYTGEELPELKLHYKDFAQWQYKLTRSGEMKKQEEYWQQQFAREIPQLALPLDFERTAVQNFDGDRVHFDINSEETNGLRSMARREDATLFMVLAAIYTLLLSKLSLQEEIIIGTGIAGRNHHDLEKIIGMFVNTLALRNYPAGEKTFLEFLREVKQNTLNAFDNQDYLFENLVEKVVKKRDINRNPLFDTVFMLQNWYEEPAQTTGEEKTPLELKPYGHTKASAMFDLMFNCFEAKEKLLFSVIYRTQLFKKESIQLYADYYQEIASRVLKNEKIKLKDIVLITDMETISPNILENDTGDFVF